MFLSYPFYGGMALGKSAKKVDKIRAIERDSFAINCLSIGLCGGMLSPLVSVA